MVLGEAGKSIAPPIACLRYADDKYDRINDAVRGGASDA